MLSSKLIEVSIKINHHAIIIYRLSDGELLIKVLYSHFETFVEISDFEI